MKRDDYVLVEQTRPRGWRGFVYRTAVDLASAIGRVFWFWEPQGTENIPRTGPLLVLANHPTYLDPPTLVALMIYYAERDLSIMAWDKLFKIPLVSFFTRTYKAYPVNRENPGRGPFVTLLNILKQGGAAGVFPEGSRSKGALMGEWKPGALRAAFSTEATILPVTLVTVGEFWPRSHWRPRLFRKHQLIVHKPLTYAEYAAGRPEGTHEREYQEVVAARIRDIINGPLIARQNAHREYLDAMERRTDKLAPTPDAAVQRQQRVDAALQRLRSGNAQG